MVDINLFEMLASDHFCQFHHLKLLHVLYYAYEAYSSKLWNAIVDKNTILSSICQNNSTMVCICVCVFGHFNSFFILTLQLSISHFITSTLAS